MRVFPFPDRTASREELTRDALYHRIPQNKRVSISDRAWETGAAAAREILKKFGPDTSIEKIIQDSGLTVERVEKDNVAGNVRYFSEYYSGRKKIVLYNFSIKQWAQANQFGYKDAEQLILSHEFFHYLECTDLGLTSRQYSVPTIRIGKFVVSRSGIRALSEIGAHGFSRTYYELCGKLPKTNATADGPLLQNYAVNSTEFSGKVNADKLFLKGVFSGVWNKK